MIRQTSVACLLLSTLAFAQFDGLDLSDTAPAPAPTKKADKAKGKGKAKADAPPAAAPAPAPAPAAAATKPAPAADSLELDLSSTADVKMVLVAPPIVKVTASTGGFAGFDTKKTSDKFDGPAHKRLVAAFEKPLSGKVLSAEASWAALVSAGVSATSVRGQAGLQKVAKAGKAGFVVLSEVKGGALYATIFDANGKEQGKGAMVAGASAISAKNADDLAAQISSQLIELSKQPSAPVVAVAEEQTVAPPAIEDEVAEPVTEFASVQKPSMFDERRTSSRIGVAVGPGVVQRSLSVSGDAADALAELRNGGTAGIGVYAHLSPLQFIDSMKGKRWADAEVEVHWRRAFTSATGVSGGVEGQTCSMTDDDLQLRGTYRYRLNDGTYATSVGLGAGFSQERTVFACELPVVSTVYRGVDLQVRVRQPMFRDILSLDAAIGPRFLIGGPLAKPGFSFSGEAWVEAKPVSFLFLRGGGRVSRIQATDNASLAVVDTRMFFGVELGAFF